MLDGTLRKVVLYIATSLDGYIADKEGKVDWLVPTGAEEDTSYEDFYAQVDTVIMGRTTYDQVVTELSPTHYPYEDVTSYIMTHESRASEGAVHFTDEAVVSLVQRLRKQPGGTIWLVGGASSIQPLVSANLIDEYQIATMPIILGEGIRLFTTDTRVALRAVKSYEKNGLIYSTYARTEG
ncbi:hypothetical protein CH76_05530 [Lysinibacillus sp. BF-4]|nr:hypothetical protein CH76_05530 [Lysinibacillus sp. BF-4]